MSLSVPDELVEARARQNYTTRHPHWDELTHTERGVMLDAARKELESEIRFRLEPGSSEARAEGCICDGDQELKEKLVVDRNCPIHGLAELKALIG